MKILMLGRISIDLFLPENISKVGGSIFNIAKSLINSKTEVEINILAPLANDQNGLLVLKALNDLGVKIFKINIDHTPIEKYDNGLKTLELFNLEEKVTSKEILFYQNEITNFDIVVADLHFIEATKKIIELNPHAKIFIDATSQLLVNRLNYLNLEKAIIKINRKQTSVFTNHILYDYQDLIEVYTILKSKRIFNGFITLDKDGCFYFEHQKQGVIKAEVVTDKKYYDAGDTFHAGLIFGYILSNDFEFMAKNGIEFSAKQIRLEIEAKFLKSFGSDK